MSFDLPPDELDEEDCGRPCDPEMQTGCCAAYWQRMRDDGFWIDRSGWTAKGMKEMMK